MPDKEVVVDRTLVALFLRELSDKQLDAWRTLVKNEQERRAEVAA